jgi:hypothetical protein
MRKTSVAVLFVAFTVVLLLVFSPASSGTSTNPCGQCHLGKYVQHLDVLEGGSAVPSQIGVGETENVTVTIENSVNAVTYSALSGVSLTLTSKNGYVSVSSPTVNIGSLPAGTENVTWQVTGVSDGYDSLVITAMGVNTHYNLPFSDSYSPSPSIAVGQPAATPPPSSATNPLSIELTSPGRGESWSPGTSHSIIWHTKGGTDPLTVTIEYSLSSIEGPWTTISSGMADKGSFAWETPNATDTAYLRVFVTDSGNPVQDVLAVGAVTIGEDTGGLILLGTVSVLLVVVAVLAIIFYRKWRAQTRAASGGHAR